jgi:hypothetical protein
MGSDPQGLTPAARWGEPCDLSGGMSACRSILPSGVKG